MKMLNFPNLRQTYDYDCGASALQSVLVYYGIEVREDEIMQTSKTTKEGTHIQDVIETIKKYDLKYTSTAMDIDEIKSFIDKGIPVIIIIQAWKDKQNKSQEKTSDNSHYVVVIGYDTNKLYFEDPSSFKTVYLLNKELKKRWHGIGLYDKKYIHHGLAIYGKEPTFNPGEIVHLD